MKYCFSLLFVALLTASAAVAQVKDVPPPPKPADEGPSLEVTMKFIQEKMSEQGKMNYAAYLHDAVNGSDWVNQFTIEDNNVLANAATCHISYHYEATRGGEVVGGGDLGFDLKTVQNVTVMNREKDLDATNADAGHPTWSSKVSPMIWALIVSRKTGPNYMYFREEDTANRVAKAIVHAVELCGGGGDKEPF